MIMGVEIKSIVQELKKISIEQILYEAITNSIQANAKKIDVDIQYHTIDKGTMPCFIDKMTITDNGDGFTKDNIKSFQTYKSIYKKHVGCKGIGRFLFLKLFDKVSINSLDQNIDLDLNSLRIKKTSNQKSNTTLTLSHAEENLLINLTTIQNSIEEHFLPIFHFIKKSKKTVEINLTANEENIFSIKSTDSAQFKTDTFTLQEETFTINYILNYYKEQNNNGFYCANNRVVIKNNTTSQQTPKLFKLNSLDDVNILFLLSSDYLNRQVNETRDNFIIYPNKTDLISTLSWEDIQSSLYRKLQTILINNGIDIKSKAQEHLKTAIQKAPYLSSYLTKNPFGKSSEKLIEESEKLLYEDKKNLRNKKNNAQEDQEKIEQITYTELAEYIFDRQNIINNLKKINNKDALEEKIHNLFMQKNTIANKTDYRSNNLWLFDDRFMAYDKVFSDIQIRTIFPALKENLDKPDILSVVSNTYEKDKITDIIIIELKRPNGNITPAGAEEQLLKYARYVNQASNKSKIRIWTYAFLAFNDNTELSLQDKSYNKIPTQSSYPIYYKYHEAHNVIINFMDYKALADDANTRNQTFINILKGKRK